MNPRGPIVDRESFKASVENLGHDLGDLFRAELRLFKKEAQAEVRPLIAAGIWLAAGAVMALAALGAFTALLYIVLTLVLAPWLAALVVTAAWGFSAVSLLAAARIKLQSALPTAFDRTAHSVKEDIEWIKSGTKPVK